MLGWLTVILLLTGCSKQDGDYNQAERPRDELILAIGGEPDEGFDPTTGWGRYGSPLFQSTLLKRDRQMNVSHDLASSYDVSGDGRVWLVEIRQDAVFSDGKPLTAADVAYTFEAAKQSSSVIDLTNLAEAVAVDTFTVQFTLHKPQSTFIDVMTTLGIVPKHAHYKGYAAHPIGSGPYQFVQWDKGQQLIVEANPNYYGMKPAFTRLTFLFLNEDAAFAAAKAGTVDAAYIPSAFSKQQVSGMRLESLQSVDNRGIMFPYVPSGAVTEDGYPVGNDVTADLAIRQAINVGLDRQALVDGILEGQGTPAYSINDGMPWWSQDTIVNDSDAERAMKILEEGGWQDSDGDSIVEKNGLKAQFTLLYPSGDVTRQSLAIVSADMLKPLGIDVKVEGKSWDDLVKLMHANAVLFGWGSLDALEMYNVYSSSYAGIDYYNPGYYSNPKVDQYMSMALAATDEAEALEYWKKAQWDGTTGLSVKGDAPWAWLVNLNHLYLINESLDIGQQPIHPHGHGWPVTSNIEQWKWIE